MSTEVTDAPPYTDEKEISYPRWWLGKSEFQVTEVNAEDLYVYAGKRFDFACKDIVIR